MFHESFCTLLLLSCTQLRDDVNSHIGVFIPTPTYKAIKELSSFIFGILTVFLPLAFCLHSFFQLNISNSVLASDGYVIRTLSR